MSTKLANVDKYMTRDLLTCAPSDSIHQAVHMLLSNRISGAPVVDEHGQLVGILSKKDCLKIIYSSSYHQELGGKVSDYMSRDVQTIESGTDVIAAADRFIATSFHRFPVMDHGRMIGLIARHDILVALEAEWDNKR